MAINSQQPGLKIKPDTTLEHNGRSQAKAGPVSIGGRVGVCVRSMRGARGRWPIKFEIKNPSDLGQQNIY